MEKDISRWKTEKVHSFSTISRYNCNNLYLLIKSKEGEKKALQGQLTKVLTYWRNQKSRDVNMRGVQMKTAAEIRARKHVSKFWTLMTMCILLKKTIQTLSVVKI